MYFCSRKKNNQQPKKTLKMKKIFGILAISALVFASCGQKTTDEAATEEATTPTEEVAANDVQEAVEEAAATIDSAATEAAQEVADAATEAKAE